MNQFVQNKAFTYIRHQTVRKFPFPLQYINSPKLQNNCKTCLGSIFTSDSFDRLPGRLQCLFFQKQYVPSCRPTRSASFDPDFHLLKSHLYLTGVWILFLFWGFLINLLRLSRALAKYPCRWTLMTIATFKVGAKWDNIGSFATIVGLGCKISRLKCWLYTFLPLSFPFPSQFFFLEK